MGYIGMDIKDENYIKLIIKHLDDIAESLRIISGRQEKVEKIVKKQPSYAEEYFARSHIK